MGAFAVVNEGKGEMECECTSNVLIRLYASDYLTMKEAHCL